MRYVLPVMLAVGVVWVLLILFVMLSKRGRAAQLARAVAYVKIGLAERLHEKYRLTYDESKARWIAASIVNYIFMDTPASPEGAMFVMENREILEYELSRLQLDEDSRTAVTQAARLQSTSPLTSGTSASEGVLRLSRVGELGIFRADLTPLTIQDFLPQAAEYYESSTRVSRLAKGDPS